MNTANSFMITNLPMCKSCNPPKYEISPILDDYESDSLSMHLSDIDSVCSIDGERFYEEKEVFYCDGAHQHSHSFDTEPILISTKRTTIVQLPEAVPEIFPLQHEHETDKSSTHVLLGSINYTDEIISHSPEFVKANDSEAIAQRKKPHEDLIQWDRNNGIKKGFSRTICKTKSSSSVVPSAFEDIKRIFESISVGNRAPKRRVTL